VACEHPVGGALRCASCGEPLEAHAIRMRPAGDAELTPPQLAAWGARG
jgi:hypothetical protein